MNLTVIEFQFSAYDRGSYLNAGINFLWESTEVLNRTLAYHYTLHPYTPRVHENERYNEGYGLTYASYGDGDAAFEANIEKFVGMALKRVMEFRKFRDLSFAKQALVKRVEELEEKRIVKMSFCPSAVRKRMHT